ncbi:sulfatase family protein [Flavihumibacter profundi]|uniref:sulfatase family protein n=1 Tax=Flavihumibacter profundi TaxID=2716883 RepID=UPI001CC5FDEB|nr:sulfatase [Flavihumibacter profundi]MBZ5856333.1 sulfatase [Flavihumibacter profundi]
MHQRLTILFILFFTSVYHYNSYAQNKRPNILVILSDDHTQQTISAYGSKLMSTPSIDRIAKEGAILGNTFVTNSICAPSRAVLLTGKYSHLNGLKDNSAERRFDGNQQQLQKLLGNRGYETAWIGKWHLQSLPQGFDYWTILPDQGNYFQPDFINMKNDTIRHEGYVTNLISDFSLAWLGERDSSKPFFLVIGEKATHRNWMPDIKDLGAFDNVNFPLPENFFDKYDNRRAALEQDMTIDNTMTVGADLKIRANYDKPNMFGRMHQNEKKAYREYYDRVAGEYDKVKNNPKELVKWKYQRYMKDYLSTARSLDRNIGRILRYLDSTGLAENTIVVYTSDQGFYMGEHGWFDKRFMYEESLRTPFMIKYPGWIKPGTRLNDMVVNIDFAPTLLDMASVPVPADIQGKSFAKQLTGSHSTEVWRKSMYYHYYEYPEPHKVAPHFGVRTMRYKLIRFYGPINEWELYDLKSDKSEMNNLYGKHGYDKQTEELKKELKKLAKEFKDEEVVKILADLEGKKNK